MCKAISMPCSILYCNRRQADVVFGPTTVMGFPIFETDPIELQREQQQ
jgi:hypothetical protein